MQMARNTLLAAHLHFFLSLSKKGAYFLSFGSLLTIPFSVLHDERMN
jgi:hypothetical protein